MNLDSRRPLVAIAFGALIAASMVTPAAAAEADPFAPVPVDSAPCPRGNDLCYYSQTNFGGAYDGANTSNLSVGQCVGLIFASQSVASIVNKSTHNIYVYSGSSCTTRLATVYARTANDEINLATGGQITHYKLIS
jgi:hypothetical protein